MEQVDADLHGWPLATWGSKQDSDTYYKRGPRLRAAPGPRSRNVRIGVAGHNLFDIALAWLLAKARGVDGRDRVRDAPGHGAPGRPRPSAATSARCCSTPPWCTRGVRRRHRLPDPPPRGGREPGQLHVRRVRAGRRTRRCSSARSSASSPRWPSSTTEVPGPNRRQDRTAFDAEAAEARVAAWPRRAGFANTPDTDPVLPANRPGAGRSLGRMRGLRPRRRRPSASTPSPPPGELDARDVHRRGRGRRLAGAGERTERAEILHRAGVALEAAPRRADGGHGAPRPARPSTRRDPEVSEAIDFAHYYAELAPGARATSTAPTSCPSRLTVVTPPWNFPVAIPAGSTLAALAAGSAVVIKPAQPAARSGAVMVEALWEAGVPRDVLQLRRSSPSATSARSWSPTRAVDRRDPHRRRTRPPSCSAPSARTCRCWPRPRGKNAIIVTPSADLDLAAKDVGGLRLRARRAEVLGRVAGDPGRFRRHLPALPHPAARRRTLAACRLPGGPAHADGPGHRAGAGQAAARR